ncbi:MAG: ribosome maturation factor RimM [Candidatus Riflebacteria bacterium]|nr:ribosome maturation factor RimM [Candidatus Riflebacteria bacterium]
MSKSEVVRLKATGTSENTEDSWIAVGKVRRTVGLHGWLRIGLLTDFPERFKPGTRVFVQKRFGEPEPVVVSEWRDHFTDTAIDLKFEGADDCDTAAAFVNAMLVVPRSEREKLRGNSDFYADELEGMTVLSPDGKLAGKVLKLESEVPCPYILVLSTDSVEAMVPFRKIFIKSVDRGAKTVRLAEPLSFHIPVE